MSMNDLRHEPGPWNGPHRNGQDNSDTKSTRTRTHEPEDKQQVVDIEEEVEQTVRELTRHSTHFSAHGSKPFFEENKETSWHPDSPSFKTKNWIRSLLAAQ